MVTLTSHPNVLRVAYSAADPLNASNMTQVVCFVTPNRSGRLTIHYHCHIWHRRAVPNGPWLEHQRIRLETTDTLKSQIAAAVMLELVQFGGVAVVELDTPVNLVSEDTGGSVTGEPWLARLAQ